MQDEKGFTLIELLVVILIIGILAAIALPAFLNQREKAQDSTAKSDVRTAQTAMETFYTDNQSYSTVDEAALKNIEPALNNANGLKVDAKSDTGYTISTESKGSNKIKFTIVNAAGTVTRSCAPVNKGGCPTDGKW
jgi:type IV pilus assembly protein PilA